MLQIGHCILECLGDLRTGTIVHINIHNIYHYVPNDDHWVVGPKIGTEMLKSKMAPVSPSDTTDWTYWSQYEYKSVSIWAACIP